MKTERRYQGVPVSPGIARGAAYIFRADEELPPRREVADVEAEIHRLHEALAATHRQITALHNRVLASLGANDAAIFESHLMVVEDGVVLEEVQKFLRAEYCNAEHAFSTVMQRYVRSFGGMDDPYLRERAHDIQDVMRRVTHNLLGKEPGGLAHLATPHIVLAHNLTPSDTAEMNRANVLGFCTEAGGRTSHTAIMARSLNIPAVVGLHEMLGEIESGTPVLLDGYGGILIVHPTAQTLYEYGEVATRRRLAEGELTSLRDTASTTRDGHHVTLSANIESPDDMAQVQAHGAEGVGLFRTEFLYLKGDKLPGEDEQTAAYTRVAEAAKPHPVILRTLDLGGDKLHHLLNATEEENPFLGWRAIRVCLERTDIFKTQLRAILRASVVGNVKLLLPMISGLPELRKAKAILDECRAELRAEGRAFAEKMEVGIMIEVPSAALIADLLAREVDFFSLGTNDLVQYTVAVDRTNERIASLYEPTHPAILRLIQQTVAAARAAGIWVGICGEMAGDIVLTPLLIGLGVEELSCGASVLPRVKRAVQSLTLTTCQTLATAALQNATGEETLALCEATAREHYAELL